LQQQYVLIASVQDLAGRTMVNSLQDKFGFKLVNGSSHEYQSSAFENILFHVSPDDLLHQEKLDDAYPMAIAFIFLSKHKSDSKIPTLTCHCTGNFGSNPFGGNARELAISFPSLQKSYLKRLVNSKDRVPEYEIIIEATHHGPTSLRKPVLFVELGSSEKQWGDANAASVICNILLDLVRHGPDRCAKVGIGLGGTHYPSKFNRLLLESEFGLAAVASKHNLESIDEPMLSQMISKSIEKVTTIVLDGKGLGPHKDRIMNMAEKTGLEILNLK
jgi:D-aminoacyl-tRNA deacylase